MTFDDTPPPSSPTFDQQLDALRKGLGRAVQWATSRQLDDKALLAACLEDLRYDLQVDGPRGDWLWTMIQAVGATDRFQAPILDALTHLRDERSIGQLCELACRYAEAGDNRFRRRLYEIVEQRPVADSPWLGEEELLRLDGETEFLFAARAIGRRLAGCEDEWDDGNLISSATQQFGEERVRHLLNETEDEAIVFFRENWRRDFERKAHREPVPSYPQRMQAIPVEKVFRAAEGEGLCFWLRGWGRHAHEADLRQVQDRLWTADDPRVVANLLQVFSGRALPEFDARLIDLCQHDVEEVRQRAIGALGRHAHPLIRDFALVELAKSERSGSVIALLVRNYRPGDEQRILEAIELPEDVNDLHWLLTEFIDVLQANSAADCFQLGVLTYTMTPCENCRYKAARLLFEANLVPNWLREECHYDSNERCRALVEADLTAN